MTLVSRAVLAIIDDGKTFAIERSVKPAWRAGCGCVLLVLGLIALTSLAMGVLPARIMTLDCDRARGTCTEAARTIPVADVKSVSLVDGRRGGRSFPVDTTTLTLNLTDGKNVYVCTAPYGSPQARSLRESSELAGAFFRDPAAPSLVVKCEEDTSTLGERIYYPVASVGLFLFALLFLPMIARVRTELDRSTRTIRVRGSFGSRIKKLEVPFSAVEAVELKDKALHLRLASAPPLLVATASDAAERDRLTAISQQIESLLRG